MAFQTSFAGAVTHSLQSAQDPPVIRSVSILIDFLCFAASFLLLAVINRLEIVPWLESEGAHWTERSRILWPARRTNGILILYVPLLLAAWSKSIADTSLLGLTPRWIAACAGAMGAGWFVVKRTHPEVRLIPWMHDLAVGFMLRIGMWGILLGAALSMPSEFDIRTWLTLAGVAVLQIVWPFLAVRLLHILGILRRPGERLLEIVERCTREGGPRVRGLWQASGLLANALAMPLSGTLIFCDKLLDHLDDDEVASICCHELGHLAESRLVLVGRHIGAMAILPLLLIKPAAAVWEFPGGMGMVALMIIWSRMSRKLIRRMETRADAIAIRHHEDGRVYARALEKIYRINHFPAVMPGKNASHPDLYDRMLAAGVTPDFPRPMEPRKFTTLGRFMLFAGPILLLWFFAG